MKRATRRSWVGLLSLAWLTGCAASPESRSLYPPENFRLNLEYRVEGDGGSQVKRRASIDAQGLVIVREADTSLRSADGSLAMPVFRRICVYQLHARSIRSLSRWLDQENVKDFNLPDDLDPPAGDVEVVEFGLVYSDNEVILVTHGRVFGQMRRVLRAINAFLPEQAGFPNGDLAADRAPSRVQDVPPLLDSPVAALAYHQERLQGGFAENSWRRDTFALACAAGDWVLAQKTLSAMSKLTEPDRLAYQKILAGAKGSGR